MAVIHAVRGWRAEGLQAYFTIDAGPNVHVICAASDRAEVERRLRELPEVLFAIGNGVGSGGWLVGN
jgi:diphosphomevalonate decarboxylase